MAVRIYKTDTPECVSAALRFYGACPPEHKPRGVRAVSSTLWCYKYVRGAHNTSWQHIRSMMQHIYKPAPITREQRERYFAYVHSLWPCSVLEPILTDELTGCEVIHGDLTFSNVIGHVFIDPGHDRGLPCRELDEAKLMQSIDGWEHVYRGWPQVKYDSFPARRIHWVLLLTHYIRMLRHVGEIGQDFARRRIDAITYLLS